VLLRRGDIALVDFRPGRSGEVDLDYMRPAVIVTNDQANAVAPVIVVVPLTSNVDRVYPFQVFLPSDCTGLDRDSKAQVELIRHVSVERVVRVLGRVREELLNELDGRLREHFVL
jgi:mRNA interferase MazF